MKCDVFRGVSLNLMDKTRIFLETSKKIRQFIYTPIWGENLS